MRTAILPSSQFTARTCMERLSSTYKMNGKGTKCFLCMCVPACGYVCVNELNNQLVKSL